MKAVEKGDDMTEEHRKRERNRAHIRAHSARQLLTAKLDQFVALALIKDDERMAVTRSECHDLLDVVFDLSAEHMRKLADSIERGGP